MFRVSAERLEFKMNGGEAQRFKPPARPTRLHLLTATTRSSLDKSGTHCQCMQENNKIWEDVS